MTRRKFIQKLVKAGSVIIVGLSWVGQRASPRRFVRAVRLNKYPGRLKSLQHTNKQAKWSG
ncbi:MAG: hypothetical protein ACYSR5_11655 [Planctomycetota bacterium]